MIRPKVYDRVTTSVGSPVERRKTILPLVRKNVMGLLPEGFPLFRWEDNRRTSRRVV